MGDIQDAFEREIDQFPRRATMRLVREKLATLGIVDDVLTGKIVGHLVDGELLEIDDDHPGVEIAFGEEDHARLSEIAKGYVDAIPELIDRLSKDGGRDFAEGFRQQWVQRRPAFDAEVQGFRERLAQRWGAPISDLYLLLELCRDLGSEFHQTHLQSRLKRNRSRNDVLARLHVRACQVTAEVLCLLEGGFSEGATARWRTLLELTVTATLIAESGDPLAERFQAYEAVETKRTMDEYQRCAPLLGEPLLSAAEVKSINADFAAALRKHGDAMKEPYGWAAGQLGLSNRPNFSQLQELAGSLPQRIYYKLASFGVHASPKGSTIQLHRFDPGLQIAGATNIGLEQPGANTAQALVRITSLLMEEPWNLDKLVLAHSLLSLREQIAEGFYGVARAIEKDEERERKKVERAAQLAIGRHPMLRARRGSGRR